LHENDFLEKKVEINVGAGHKGILISSSSYRHFLRNFLQLYKEELRLKQ
jgi:hypothetical protein